MTARLLPLRHPDDFSHVRAPSNRRFVLRCIARLKNDPLYGERLHDNSTLAGDGRTHFDLAGCRKLKIGVYRVVYRVLPNEIDCWYVDVVAIGHRSDVYALAHERMKERRGLAA